MELVEVEAPPAVTQESAVSWPYLASWAQVAPVLQPQTRPQGWGGLQDSRS